MRTYYLRHYQVKQHKRAVSDMRMNDSATTFELIPSIVISRRILGATAELTSSYIQIYELSGL
jgi:hypothetical protein